MPISYQENVYDHEIEKDTVGFVNEQQHVLHFSARSRRS